MANTGTSSFESSEASIGPTSRTPENASRADGSGPRWDLSRWRYPLYASLLTAWVAIQFFSQIKHQLFLSASQRGMTIPDSVWSAPLDDTFIHFDFARSLARGFPFQWVEGNGYSSGGTSALYPFALAVGYWLGFRQTTLMLWAGIIACISILITLLAARRLFIEAKLPDACAYLLPPMFLGIGALDWSLFSGMEVAFFMAVWAGCLLTWLAARRSVAKESIRRTLWLGIAAAALVATRPEAICLVAVFALTLAATKIRSEGVRTSLTLATISCAPALLVMVGQAVANRLLTGEWSAAGALVKLEVNHPYLSAKEIWGAWGFHIKYQALRVTEYHLAAPLKLGSLEIPGVGWIWWLFALVPWTKRSTRGIAALLWGSIIAWVLMVALNGQVRWQNERYTMPALAFLLVSAGLGGGILLTQAARLKRPFLPRVLLGVATIAGLVVVAIGQYPRFCEQLWFFGRASRNIYDQHVTVAAILRSREPQPHRVLVGDAGAIPYLSELPALDLIGLGGYHDLPFARASRQGVAAAIELIGRIPPSERPDLLAVYPGWWGDFVHWFGEREAAVGVRGNVICGGPFKVIYRANWSPLENSERPFLTLKDGSVLDALDVGDIVSEREHHQRLFEAPGFVTMKMLPNPSQARTELWDAGRALPPNGRLAFSFDRRLASSPNKQLDLILRLAPSAKGQLASRINGTELEPLDLAPMDGWDERRIPIPTSITDDELRIELEARGSEAVLYHVWMMERP